MWYLIDKGNEIDKNTNFIMKKIIAIKKIQESKYGSILMMQYAPNFRETENITIELQNKQE